MAEIIVTVNNIHITDSWQYSKFSFLRRIEEIAAAHPECLVTVKRDHSSLAHEWAVHNALYNLGLFRSHTKDVDLNYPMKEIIEGIYDVIGWFVWPFIK